MGSDNDSVRERYIPPNYKEGVSILGFMIRPGYVLQALPFILVVILIVFIPLHSISFAAKLVIIAVVCVPVTLLCTVGINGDSVYKFIANSIRCARTKRTCLYNPRIKKEIKPLSESPIANQQIPRERILMFIEKFKKEKEAEIEEIDFTNLFFEDDEGIVEKPFEYMSAKEQRNYLKEKK